MPARRSHDGDLRTGRPRPGGRHRTGSAPRAGRFAQASGIGIGSVEDPPPYPASDAYDIVSVPTLYLVEDGAVADVVGAWDRDGFNRVAATLAGSVGAEPVAVSTPDDGLPAFQPG